MHPRLIHFPAAGGREWHFHLFMLYINSAFRTRPWYLYQMVTQNMLRMFENIFFNHLEFAYAVDLNNCLKHIKLTISFYTCAIYFGFTIEYEYYELDRILNFPNIWKSWFKKNIYFYEDFSKNFSFYFYIKYSQIPRYIMHGTYVIW